MKKSIIPAVFALAVVIMVSCQKESSQQAGNKTNLSASARAISSQSIISSDWLTLPFVPVTTTPTTRNLVFLNGHFTITSPVSYDLSQSVQLAYAKIPGRDGFYYVQLPGICNPPGQNIEMGFVWSRVSFDIKLWNNDDHSLVPNAYPFQFFKFRYIVIPQSVYQGMSINWSDYYAVAAALHLSL